MLHSDVFDLSPEDFEREARRLRQLARGILYDEQASEDVVQEAWLAALNRRSKLRGGSIAAWLTGAVRNLAIDRSRRALSRGDREAASARPEAIESALGAVERLDLSRRLLDAVGTLPEHERTVVILRFLDELPPREIARRLDLPVATVRTRLARALAKLRAKLDPGNDEERARMLSVLLPLAGVPPFALSWPSTGSESAAELAPWIGSLTMSKKSLAVLLALLVVIATPFGLSVLNGEPPAEGGAARTAGLEAAVAPSAPEPEAQPIASAIDAGEARQSLEAPSEVRWTVRGRVVDDDFTPLPDVGVELAVHAGYDERGDVLERARAWSDADGQLEWDLDVPVEAVHLEATALGELHTMTGSAQVLSEGTAPQDLVVRIKRLDAELTGTVIDDSGAPIEGAWVSALGGEVFTDERGAFVARTASRSSGEHLLVRADGFADRKILTGPREPGRSDVGVIELASDRVLRGRVVDPEGAPLVGAVVSSAWRGGRETTTNGAGGFSLGGYDAEKDWWQVVVEAPGYVSLSRLLEDDPFATELELTLVAAAELAGRVVDARGAPIEGARITAARSPRSIPSLGGWSDASGAFHIADVPVGEQKLWATRQGFAGLITEAAFTAGATTHVELQLETGEALRGIVLDADGQPVASAWVSANVGDSWLSDGLDSSTRTDAEGRFELANLRHLRHHLGVIAEGFERHEVDDLLPGSDEFELVLTRSGGIAGRVVDGRTGEPLDAFVVQLVRPKLEEGDVEADGHWSGWRTGLPFQGTGGSFSTEGEDLDLGHVVGVRVSAEGFAPTTVARVVTTSDPDPDELVIELFPGVELAGQVVDEATGAPLPNAQVSLLLDEPLRHHWDRDGTPAELDAQARFRFEQMHTGSCWLLATHEGYANHVDGPFEIGEGGLAELRTIGLHRGATVVVRVRTAAGPVEGATLLLAPEAVPASRSWSSQRVETDALGEARFELLAAGTYTIQWTERRDDLTIAHARHEFEVDETGTEEIELRHGGDATVEGTLAFDDGSQAPPLAVVWLTPHTPDGQRDPSRPTRMAFAEDGRFEIQEVVAGFYLTTARAEARVTPAPVDLESGRTASVEVRLTKLPDQAR